MRILAIHSAYRQRGGEDVSHSVEVAELQRRGHDVQDLRFDNADLASRGSLRAGVDTMYSRSASQLFREAVNAFRPDLCYVNNLWPAASPSILVAAIRAGIPTTQVFRNYRRGCISGDLMRNGRLCTQCLARPLGLSGIRYRCSGGQLSRSIAATAARAVTRRAHSQARMQSYIAVSEYVRGVLETDGLRKDRITVRPNLVSPQTSELQSDVPVVDILFVGRLEGLKGVSTLLEAADHPKLRGATVGIAGSGPMREAVLASRCKYFGALSPTEVHAAMSAARTVVVPSMWPEPFGRVAVEALACGTPVVVSDCGGLPEFVGKTPAVGMFRSGSAEGLVDALVDALEAGEILRSAARSAYKDHYSPDAWYAGTTQAFSLALAP